MFPNTKFGLFVFTNQIHIQTPKFGLRINNKDGAIEKQYTSNSYECIIAEQELSKVCLELIDWTKNKPNTSTALVSILHNILLKDFKSVTCFKHHETVKSVITFSGIFNNVYINETLFIDAQPLQYNRLCMSKEKAAQYIVERGYFIFSTDNKDISDIKDLEQLYLPHTLSIIDEMSPIINASKINTEEVKDVVLNQYVSSSKLNNDIVITPMKDIPDMDYLFKNKTGKSYWGIIQT
jgi:hypothetical protein